MRCVWGRCTNNFGKCSSPHLFANWRTSSTGEKCILRKISLSHFCAIWKSRNIVDDLRKILSVIKLYKPMSFFILLKFFLFLQRLLCFSSCRAEMLSERKTHHPIRGSWCCHQNRPFELHRQGMNINQKLIQLSIRSFVFLFLLAFLGSYYLFDK